MADSRVPRSSAPGTYAPRPVWRVWWVRGYRLGILLAAAWLIFIAHQRVAATSAGPVITLETAQCIFPAATRLGLRDIVRDGHDVYDAQGAILGFVMKTAPRTDDLIGYTGPNDLLIGFDAHDRIQRVLILSSGDTQAHVDAVARDERFWEQFTQWEPDIRRFPDISAVSGSTLTSLAIAEGVQRRLGASATSLRFPDEVSLAEVQSFFSTAVAKTADTPLPGWTQATDAAGATLGYVIRTSPATDSLIGYAGPTESLLAVGPDQQTIVGVRLRSSYDTADYVDRVRNSEDFFALFAGRTRDELQKLDFVAAGIEGVSGATQTSYAVAEGLRQRILADERLQTGLQNSGGTMSMQARDVGLLSYILAATWMTFVRWPRGRWVRSVWQLILIAGFGLWLGDLLSIALLAGWSRQGIASTTAPVLLLLVGVSLLTPWTTRQQIYCHQLCPHGAAQEWLGKFRRCHVSLGHRWSRWLGFVPGILLIVGFALAVFWPQFDLASLEPFDGWILKTGAAASFTLLIGSLLVSIFIPQGYCRFGCPTGTLLKFVRSHGRTDRFGWPELVAGISVSVAAGALFVPIHEFLTAPTAPLRTTASPIADLRLTGEAFGTKWSVTFRRPLPDPVGLRDQLSAELERIESRLSHWRPGSATSQFNSSETTFELDVPRELVELLAFCQTVSAATSGRYDVTVGPLVDAWGYGPSGPQAHDPAEEIVQNLLKATGWEKLHVDTEYSSLRKDVANLGVDLGSVLQGYAADRLTVLLTQAGIEEFLIDVGGELSCRGTWSVAVEGITPESPLQRVTLTNQALATSGIYRPTANGKPETQHVISPQTGCPISTPHVLAAVLSPSARDADAWATACLASDTDTAVRLAEERQFSLLLVDRDGAITRTGTFQTSHERETSAP